MLLTDLAPCLDLLLSVLVILGKKYVPHAVVIAASLSNEEVFIKPHPKLMQDRDRFFRLMEQTTHTRIRYDARQHSDALSALRIFRLVAMFVNDTCHCVLCYSTGS